MESLTSTTTTASTSTPPAGHTSSEEGFSPKNHYGSLVGGRTRQRVNSSFAPATPPPHVAVDQTPITAPNRLPFHLEAFVRSPQRPNVADNDHSATPRNAKASPQDERTRWDVENTRENRRIWKEFVYLSSIPIPSPPSKESASSIYTDAQIALSQFTPMEKLRAILIGSNKKSVKMGEMYFSPLFPIDELVPTSGLFNHEELESDGIIKDEMSNTFRRVVAELHKDFDQTADLMENFIFPVRLIDPFNLAIRIINHSPFLRYLLVRWRDLVWSSGLGQSLTGTRCNFTLSRATANPEILFLEWYIASSQPLIRFMLTMLVSKAGLEYQRLMIDFHGNALLVTQNESIERAITREIETMAAIRRELTVAIDTLFRQRVKMLRPPLSTEKSSKKNVEEGNTLAQKARKRDSRSLRVKLGKRARASLPVAVHMDEDDEDNGLE